MPGCLMQITVYCLEDGRYVLVPACFEPSMACHHRHGPMQRCGDVSIADALCQTSWHGIMAQIERRDFAVVGPMEAAKLLGADHACLKQLPQQRLEPDGGLVNIG